jgi:hypothetical protein
MIILLNWFEHKSCNSTDLTLKGVWHRVGR